MARRYYNGAVRNNNVAVETFPGNLIASRFGFSKSEFFEIEDQADRAVPEGVVPVEGPVAMSRWVVCLVAAVAMLVGGTAAHAEEQILSFLADVTVEKSGALLVSETIEVNAEGNEIRRGIYRDIPLRTTDENGLWDSERL